MPMSSTYRLQASSGRDIFCASLCPLAGRMPGGTGKQSGRVTGTASLLYHSDLKLLWLDLALMQAAGASGARSRESSAGCGQGQGGVTRVWEQDQ